MKGVEDSYNNQQLRVIMMDKGGATEIFILEEICYGSLSNKG